MTEVVILKPPKWKFLENRSMRTIWVKQGWLKSAILGGSSYKELNPVPEPGQNKLN